MASGSLREQNVVHITSGPDFPTGHFGTVQSWPGLSNGERHRTSPDPMQDCNSGFSAGLKKPNSP